MATNEFIVHQSHAGLLYEDGAFTRVLPPGKHKLGTKKGFFSVDETERKVEQIDMRERSVTIKGQEILTADKVAIRVSLLVYFKILDAVKAKHNVASYEERIYEDVQLAARRFLASRKLEAILTDRNEISDAVRDDVKGTATVYGVEIIRADVKDLVFPGNLREIMNQVLETERRAEAKIIEARREAEVAKIKADSERVVAKVKAELELEVTKLKTTAELETSRVRSEALREQMRLAAEGERERVLLKLKGDIEEAKAVKENPQLMRLRELSALGDMARAGGKFAVGLGQTAFASVLRDEK